MVRDLDLNVVVSSLLNGICWSIYAMLIDDDLLLVRSTSNSNRIYRHVCLSIACYCSIGA